MTFLLGHPAMLLQDIGTIWSCWSNCNLLDGHLQSKSPVVQVVKTFPNWLKQAKNLCMEHCIRSFSHILHSEPLLVGQLKWSYSFERPETDIPAMSSGLNSLIFIPNFSNNGIIIAKIHCIFYAHNFTNNWTKNFIIHHWKFNRPIGKTFLNPCPLIFGRDINDDQWIGCLQIARGILIWYRIKLIHWPVTWRLC